MPRPVRFQQFSAGRRGESRSAFAHVASLQSCEILCDRQDIGSPVRQRGYVDPTHLDAIEKVRQEPSPRQEMFGRGRHQGRRRVVLLQELQQTRLGRVVHVRYMPQHERATLRATVAGFELGCA